MRHSIFRALLVITIVAILAIASYRDSDNGPGYSYGPRILLLETGPALNNSTEIRVYDENITPAYGPFDLSFTFLKNDSYEIWARADFDERYAKVNVTEIPEYHGIYGFSPTNGEKHMTIWVTVTAVGLNQTDAWIISTDPQRRGDG